MMIHACDVCKRMMPATWESPEVLTVHVRTKTFEFCQEHSKPILQLLKEHGLVSE
jgi:hypothetical protein